MIATAVAHAPRPDLFAAEISVRHVECRDGI